MVWNFFTNVYVIGFIILSIILGIVFIKLYIDLQNQKKIYKEILNSVFDKRIIRRLKKRNLFLDAVGRDVEPLTKDYILTNIDGKINELNTAVDDLARFHENFKLFNYNNTLVINILEKSLFVCSIYRSVINFNTDKIDLDDYEIFYDLLYNYDVDVIRRIKDIVYSPIKIDDHDYILNDIYSLNDSIIEWIIETIEIRKWKLENED